MNNLVVGKNSKVCRALGNISGVEFVSHADLPIKGVFNVVYVFSFSRRMFENERLIDQVNGIKCNHVVYVSSIAADLAYIHKYNYPTIKRKCEDISKLYNFSVLRIGLIIETMIIEPTSGDYLVTPLSDLKTMLRNGELACNAPVLRSYGRGPSKLQLYYGFFLDFLGGGSIFFRPIDFVLKLFGYNWGGYNAIVVARFRRKSDLNVKSNTF